MAYIGKYNFDIELNTKLPLELTSKYFVEEGG
jgi:hypothetical protein